MNLPHTFTSQYGHEIKIIQTGLGVYKVSWFYTGSNKKESGKPFGFDFMAQDALATMEDNQFGKLMEIFGIQVMEVFARLEFKGSKTDLDENEFRHECFDRLANYRHNWVKEI